jgi:multisubunit Na+/H+ antiporter MnhF subunit
MLGLGNMMRRYGPINPLPEMGCFFLFVAMNILIGKGELFSSMIRRQIWNYGVVLVFISLVTVLCIRVIKGNTLARAYSTAGFFGFFSGSLLWYLFIASEGISLSYMTLMSVFKYGLVSGALALILSALEVNIYRVVKGRTIS